MERKLEELLMQAVPKEKCALLFSGGIDSLVLAGLMKNCEAFTVGTEKSKDIESAEREAGKLGVKLNKVIINEKIIKEKIPLLISIIGEVNPVKTGVGLVKLIALEEAKKKGFSKAVAGSGADELFAGYARMKKDANKQCKQLAENYWKENDYLLRIAEHVGIELVLPYMDERIVSYALSLPEEWKIRDNENKYVLRKLGEKTLGESAWRKKTAAQYGSGVDKLLEKLAKPKTKTQYLKEIFPLAALFSGGKDSCYAIQKMIERGFEVKCLITIKSKNPDSYMFHTPAINLTELQAKAMQIPLLIMETAGEKEKELEDLKKAVKEAQEKYSVKGIITGALHSEYQSSRIKKICGDLGLACFNPLWRYNQEQEMREVVKNFEIILTGVAAYGLDKSWLGRKITSEDVDKLMKIHEKYKINVAGEGGEFESLVINAPFFSRKIEIKDYKVKMENEFTGRIIINKAELAAK